jgi:parallel beta-helix repeat protein
MGSHSTVRKLRTWQLVLAATLSVALGAATAGVSSAATLCVNPGGTGTCFKHVQDAVNAAASGDTIKVAPGTYAEDVVIGKSLSLIGHGSAETIIDASGLGNAVYVDGLDNSGLSDVIVAGFTMEKANFEGLLVTNASNVLIRDNRVEHNDQALSGTNCPGIPDFETLEGFDCGEGIHLSGVSNSTVLDNLVTHNAGGILFSDDTGATHDNLITSNIASDNPSDCGITLASHPPATVTGSSTPLGVSHNTIAGNVSSDNGLSVEGAGAGVGIFDSVPGTMNFGNVVMGNVLEDNGLPGVALHSHAPNQNLDDNVIIDNEIAGNGKDTEDAATAGPTGINVFGCSFGGCAPVTGTIILRNRIRREGIDIAANTPGTVAAHFNDLLGKKTGVDNLGSGTVDAAENWWGCSGGPGKPGCADIKGAGVSFAPWLKSPF